MPKERGESFSALSLPMNCLREAPAVIECWRCGENRRINSDCFVEKCSDCGDGSYEYDVGGEVETMKRWKETEKKFKR